MKVKLTNKYTSSKGCFSVGTEILVSDEEGQQLVDGGYADEVKPVEKVEPEKTKEEKPKKKTVKKEKAVSKKQSEKAVK